MVRKRITIRTLLLVMAGVCLGCAVLRIGISLLNREGWGIAFVPIILVIVGGTIVLSCILLAGGIRIVPTDWRLLIYLLIAVGLVTFFLLPRVH